MILTFAQLIVYVGVILLSRLCPLPSHASTRPGALLAMAAATVATARYGVSQHSGVFPKSSFLRLELEC